MDYLFRDGETEVMITFADPDQIKKDRESRIRGYQSALEEIKRKKSEKESVTP